MLLKAMAKSKERATSAAIENQIPGEFESHQYCRFLLTSQ
jgi:hypothetical protein